MDTNKNEIGEHIMVCLSPSPSNRNIIMIGAQMAKAFDGSFTALYVDTNTELSKEDNARLKEHIKLAESYGAVVETTYGDDVSVQIAEYARIAGVTKIVIGRSNVRKRHLWSKPTLVDRLLKLALDVNIHIIPDSGAKEKYANRIRRAISGGVSVKDVLVTGIVLVLATLVGFLFQEFGFINANIITIYLLGMLMVSILTKGWICNLLGAIASVLAFNYFFVGPKFTFMVYDKGYPVTFLIMFFTSLLTGTLMSKIKHQSKESAKSAFRNKVLFETNQLLQKAVTDEEILQGTAKQLQILLNRTIHVYISGENRMLPIAVGQNEYVAIDDNEAEIVQWVFTNNKRAGATTGVFSEAEGLYLAVRTGNAVHGVVGIDIGKNPPEMFEYSMVLSVLGECALAMENNRNSKEKEKIALLAKSEQLRADLLRSISHDLRTPLTSISGNANNLLYNYSRMDEELREQIFKDIYDDSMWLINVVENLLAVTRIDNGQIRLNISTELVDEIISEAISHAKRISNTHHFDVQTEDGIILVDVDGRLIVQVMINLLDNAIKYTPNDATICVKAGIADDMAQIQVIDDGPGIPKESKPYIFDMFYTVNSGVADSRRSLGLGLSLCKSIVQAHNGTIMLEDNEPHGCIFTIRLPIGKVKDYEQNTDFGC
ncbi:MAG: DUF4118 domain-containing protein [Lachnospiraceae bacterium]|nr:DUF4118 domain-containing protein [Lachnospiraceae bacterium]